MGIQLIRRVGLYFEISCYTHAESIKSKFDNIKVEQVLSVSSMYITGVIVPVISSVTLDLNLVHWLSQEFKPDCKHVVTVVSM